MGSWNDVPNEILQRVLVKLAYTGNLYQCLQVNRQWLTLCQAILYKKVVVNVDFADNVFHTLVHSPFQCGQFAKYILIKELNTPPDGDVNDLDPLVLLMERCPSVEEVNFYPNAIDPERMEYFIKVLTRANSWKLHTLPSVCFVSQEQFYRLADQTRDSLERLPVDGLSGDIQFDFLAGYRKLAHISLQAKDMTDCIQVLKHAPPTLTRLDASFNSNMHLKVADSWNDDRMKIRPCPNLKSVQLSGVALAGDKDLSFIMTQFRAVNRLYIFGSSELFPTISTPVKNAFFEFLQGIPRHSVTLFVCDELDWLELFYSGSSNRNRIDSAAGMGENRRSILNLQFQNYGERPYCTMSISTNIDNSLSYTTEKPEIVQQKTEGALYRVGHQLHLFSIFLPVSFALNGLMETILNTCSSLDRLTIGGGFLTGQTQIFRNDHQSITQLILSNVDLHEGALLTLSQSFPRLEYLEIEDCEFAVNRQTNINNEFGNLSINDSKPQMYEIDISMDHTNFGSINVMLSNNPMFQYYEGEPKDAIFLSIFISDNVSKYYVKYGAKNIAEVETKEDFQRLEQLCKNSDDKDDKITTVRVKVKSMKTFTFTTTKHTFKLGFDDVQ